MTYIRHKEPKAKVCPNCESAFRPFGIQKYCSPACEREVKTGRSKLALEKMEFPDLHFTAKGVFNSWIKQRDAKCGCVSCARRFDDKQVQWQCGHWKKAELYSGVEFDEMNTAKQCIFCNTTLDGNVDCFEKELIIRHGINAVAELSARANLTRRYKYSRPELVEIVLKYRKP
jgi:hypothetical protein